MFPTSSTVPYERRPSITYALMLVCVATFLYQISLSGPQLTEFLMRHALVPARYTSGQVPGIADASHWDLSPFLTSMFLHGGLLHLLSNMWVLWVFGPAIEDRLGPGRFLALYVAAGLAGGLVHMLFNLFSPIPALGASGAIAGVIAAFTRRFPWGWVNVLQPILFLPLFFTIPALAFAAIWFLGQILGGTMALFGPEGGGVAWGAHIGGFIAGWLLVRRVGAEETPAADQRAQLESAFWPWRTWWRWQSRWLGWWFRR